MPDGKLLQLPSTHFLGQRFSEVFNINFEDREGNKSYAWQTCYGPGISRILGAIIAIHGDDKGLVLPYYIAPVQIVIVPIFTADNRREVLGYSKKVASKLKQYRVQIDSRTEYTPGWKYNEWEMKGVPLRIEVGPKEMKKKQVVFVRRDNGRKSPAGLKSISKLAKRMLEDIHNAMISKVDRILKNSTHSAKIYAELKSMLDKGGIVRVDFCSIDKDGESCADKIKTELNADVKGIRHEIAEKPHGKCIICGRDAKVIAYVGKSY
jgi:prolyl-tRNA synthetase